MKSLRDLIVVKKDKATFSIASQGDQIVVRMDVGEEYPRSRYEQNLHPDDARILGRSLIQMAEQAENA